MKWIKLGVVQNMFGVWLAYLLLLLVTHRISPDDPWAAMLVRPVFLIVMPLLAACIPLLATGPGRSLAADYVEEERDGDFPDEAKPTTSDTVRRMAMVWLASLLIFASPHQGTLGGLWDPVIHRTAFLIFAPLLLALIPILLPVPVRRRRATPTVVPAISRSRVWKGIFGCMVLAILAVGALLLINDTSMRNGRLWPNVIFVIWLVGALLRGWYFVKLLKTSR